MFQKGKLNPNYRGGIADYPNHAFMKKQRLIILIQNSKCEKCGNPATEIHHKDLTKINHKLSNLMAICRKCNLFFHKNERSKHLQIYGKTFKELVDIGIKRYNLSKWKAIKKVRRQEHPFNFRCKANRSWWKVKI